MRKFILILLLSLLCIPAYAILPEMYLGGSLEVNAPSGDFVKKSIQDHQGGAKLGTGGEFDLGLTAGVGSVYLGYRMGQLNAKTDTSAIVSTKAEKWKLDRGVIGVRWHVLGSKPLPIVPTLGGGLTFGVPKMDVKDMTTGKTTTESAKSSLGWFLEAGALLRPPGSLSVIANIQYHSFDSKFDKKNLGNFKISFVTVQAGIRYSFPVF